MNRFILCLFLLAPAFAALAEDSYVSITPKWQTALESEPRNKVTVIFQLRNNLQEALKLDSSLQLPAGWKMLIEDTPLELGAGKEGIRILTFFIPREAQAGPYKIGYYVTREGTEDPLGSFHFSINVLPFIGIDLKLKNAPSYMLSGEDYDVVFTLSNYSNTDVAIGLKFSSSYGLVYELIDIPSEEVHLNIEETRELKVRVKAQNEYTRIIKSGLTVLAECKNAAPAAALAKYKTKASAYFNVEIFPRISEEKEAFHTIPLEIIVSHSEKVGEDWTGNAGLEVSGSGTIDDTGKHHIDLHLRKLLDFPYSGFLNPQDLYSLSYWNDNFEVKLGDQHYSLSPLLENSSFARGAEIRGNFNQFGLGGYYHFTPDSEPLRQSAAGSVDFSFFHSRYPGIRIYTVHANVLSNISSNILLSLYQEFKPLPELDFELEVAAGSPFSSELYWAGMVKGQFKYKWLSSAAAFTIAQPGYPGDFADRYRFSVSNNLVFFDNTWNIYTAYSQEQQNLTLDENLDSAPFAWNVRLGTRYKWRRFNTDLFLAWVFNSRKDRLLIPDFDEQTNGIDLSFIQPVSRFEIQGYAGWDFLNNKLLSARATRQQYTAVVSFVPNLISRYSLNFSINALNSEYSADSLRIAWGMGLSYEFEKAKWRLSFNNSYFLLDKVYTGTDFNVTSSLDYNFNDVHGLSADASLQIPQKTDTSGPGFRVTLKYTARPDVPVSRKSNTGYLRGYIYSKATNEPMQNIILRIGNRVVITDKKGKFSFSSLIPGDYVLQVDTFRAGTGLLPDSKIPIIVQLKNKKTTDIKIGILESGKIEGTVTLYAAPKKIQGLLSLSEGADKGKYREDDLVVDSGYSKVLIEIERDDESRRLQSDNKGSFSFQDIRPGQWTLRVFPDYLPPGHYFKEETFTLTVTPGGTEKADIKIFPEKKVLSGIEDKGVLYENGKTGNGPAKEEGAPPPETVEEDFYVLVDTIERINLPEHENTPELLNLKWGISFAEAESILLDKDRNFGKLAHISQMPPEMGEAGKTDEDYDLARSSLIRYFSPGLLQYNLPGNVLLTFYNPLHRKDQLYLSGVEIQLSDKDASGVILNSESVFKELVTIFLSKWNIHPDDASSTAIFQEGEYAVELNNVNIIYKRIPENNRIIASYENQLIQKLISRQQKAKGN